MENPFKQIIENEQVPEVLRDKVLNDIRLIKLSMDLADLVTVKYPSSILDIFGSATIKSNKKKK